MLVHALYIAETRELSRDTVAGSVYGTIHARCIHKRGLCRRAVSVRLSATFVYCVKTSKHIIKLFSASGSHTIVVFPYQTSRRGHPHRGVECRCDMKKRHFRPISRFISDMIIGLIRNRNANRMSYAIYRIVPFPMTLNDL